MIKGQRTRKPTKVLVVDDSALMRKLLPQIIERDSSLQVVGTAMDGTFALKKITEMQPQVITLDLEMPRMDGMETLREITRHHHIPVIVVSAHSTQGAASTFKALAHGAFDFVAKPKDAASAHMEEIANELIEKIRAAANSQHPQMKLDAGAADVRPTLARFPRTRKPPARIIAIGVSTGGPNAIQYVLSQLPPDFPGSILIVQHMPEGFTEMFARRLNDCCSIDVKEAEPGDLLLAGRALICPGNRHMKVKRMPLGDIAVITDDERVNNHRPSVDVLFRSVAREFGPAAIGVLMTGMGEDGANGIGEIKESGGTTIAQSADSCVVFGMPKAAIDRGFAQRVVSLEAMAKTLQTLCRVEPNRAVIGTAESSGN